LRIFFDENKDDMTKKQLHICLEKYKLRLRTKEKKVRRKIKKNSVILNCDLACFLDKKGSIYGRHIYEKIFDKRVGCMKKGTFLEPILEYRNEVICSLSDKNSIRILKHNLCYA
jgi:hypothetical protein